MCEKNPRIKDLYNHKCKIHNNKCLILDGLCADVVTTNNKNVHILDMSYNQPNAYLDNLPQTIEFLEIFNLNCDLTNLPTGLQKLCIVSYPKLNIKVPFGCKFIEVNTDYTWVQEIGRFIIKDMRLEIGGIVSHSWNSQMEECCREFTPDPNSHTGFMLDEKINLIYELAKYDI